MTETPIDPRAQRRTRLFLLLFFGFAALLIVTTIFGTLRNMDLQKEMEDRAAAESSAPVAPPAQ